MANSQSFSTNLALGVIPEIDPKKDSQLFQELSKIRSAIRNLAISLDLYTGNSGSSSYLLSGRIPYGSGSGLISTPAFTYDPALAQVALTNLVGTGTLTFPVFSSGVSTMGFYSNAPTPIVQPTTGSPSAGFVANAGVTINDSSTFDGYTVKQVVKALRNLGLLA